MNSNNIPIQNYSHHIAIDLLQYRNSKLKKGKRYLLLPTESRQGELILRALVPKL